MKRTDGLWLGTGVVLLAVAACAVESTGPEPPDPGAPGAAESGAAGHGTVVGSGAGALVRIRLPPGSGSDESPDAWTLQVGGRPVSLGDANTAAIVAVRRDDGSVDLHVQALTTAAPGDSYELLHLPSGQRWVGVLAPGMSTRIPLASVELRDSAGGGGGSQPLETAIAELAAHLRRRCAVELAVTAHHEIRLGGAEAVARGVFASDEEIALYVPETLAGALAGLPAQPRLRVLLAPWGKAVALTPMLYEFAGQRRLVPPVLTYDHTQPDPATARPATGAHLRFALVNVAPPSGPDRWPWPHLAVHELGHMLGLSHPVDTAGTDDDFRDNLMTGDHRSDDPPAGQAGPVHLSQRQCLLLALDLNGYADRAAAP
jgi:hypothetical protein